MSVFVFHKNIADLTEHARVFREGEYTAHGIKQEELRFLCGHTDCAAVEKLFVGGRHMDSDGYIWERVE